MPTSRRVDPSVMLAGLAADLKASNWYNIGYPGASDLKFWELSGLMAEQLLNNVGDPHEHSHDRRHTKPIEQQVVATIADLLRAPRHRWGYVTTGSSEAALHAMDEGARRYPDALVYASAAAHYSVLKNAALLRLPLITVATHRGGQLDVDGLARVLQRHRDRAAIIVATAGTTMTEAVDDVAAITQVCDRLRITRRRIHVDAALSGIPLALLPDDQRPAFDFTAGATSMAVSGQKFFGTPMPCGVLVYAGRPLHRPNNQVPYIGSSDTTIVGSRSGHTPLMLWWALTTQRHDGHRRRAEASRELAEYTLQQLRAIGWPCDRQPHAFTVTLEQPPSTVTDKWVLASDRDTDPHPGDDGGGTAHIVCMPGVVQAQIDEFVTDLRRVVSLAHGDATHRPPHRSAAVTDLIAMPDLAREQLLPALPPGPVAAGATFEGSRDLNADADLIAGGVLVDDAADRLGGQR
jgi:histidine decarboxylase